MSYLNVAPMMVALRETPEAFEYKHGYLRHLPSDHDFIFDQNGGVRIRTVCYCSQLSIRPGQETELVGAFHEWERAYWRPLMINREFASHFRARSAWRQLLVGFTGWLHRLALRPETTRMRDRPAPAIVLSPAE